MSYGSDINAEGKEISADKSVKGVIRPKAGISSGWKMISFGMDTNRTTGEEVTTRGAVEFQSSRGESFKYTILEANPDWENYEKKVEEITVNLKHIATKVLTHDEWKASIKKTTSFADFVKTVGKAVMAKYDGSTFDLKIVYNNKNYQTFPKFPNFIRKEGDESVKLYIDPKWDVIERKFPTEMAEETVSKTGTEDLPF